MSTEKRFVKPEDGMKFLEAVKAGSIEQINKMLEENPALINFQDGAGRSAIFYVLNIFYLDSNYFGPNNPETARVILDARPDTLIQNNVGRTALMTAVLGGDINSVVAILKATPDLLRAALVDKQDERGHSALMVAIGDNRTNLVEILLLAGASLNLQDKEGRCARDRIDSEDLDMQNMVEQFRAAQRRAFRPEDKGGDNGRQLIKDVLDFATDLHEGGPPHRRDPNIIDPLIFDYLEIDIVPPASSAKLQEKFASLPEEKTHGKISTSSIASVPATLFYHSDVSSSASTVSTVSSTFDSSSTPFNGNGGSK